MPCLTVQTTQQRKDYGDQQDRETKAENARNKAEGDRVEQKSRTDEKIKDQIQKRDDRKDPTKPTV